MNDDRERVMNDAANPRQPPNGGTRPVPDPTVLTTAQLIREVFGLRELIEARLEGMDKAIELLQEATDRIPAHMKETVQTLRELHDEKFAGIDTQFQERDTRTAETASLNKLAIDAALQAQKEAAGKSEEGFTKQIEKLGELIETKTVALGSEIRANMNALSDRATANKERLDRIEGGRGQETTHRDTTQWLVGAIVGAAGFAIAAVALLVR